MGSNSTLALRGNSEGEVVDFKQYARCEGRPAREELSSLANRLKSTMPKREASGPFRYRLAARLPWGRRLLA